MYKNQQDSDQVIASILSDSALHQIYALQGIAVTLHKALAPENQETPEQCIKYRNIITRYLVQFLSHHISEASFEDSADALSDELQ